jgi:2,4-dienoyl-CoA reductase-like NADH-dependent reductase (Old Yellow Enzyme family)
MDDIDFQNHHTHTHHGHGADMVHCIVSYQAGMLKLFKKPRALTHQEIEEVIERFANTSVLAEKAGFDGVQIHLAHGYLLRYDIAIV